MNLRATSIIHDIENYPNWFSDVFKDPLTNDVFILVLYKGFTNELRQKAVNAFKTKKGLDVTIFKSVKEFYDWFDFDKYLVGYNSYHYDDLMLSELINVYERFVNRKDIDGFLKHLYTFGTNLINADRVDKRGNIFKTLDVMRVANLDRIYKPLKQTAANLKHHTIQDLPIRVGSIIEDKDVVDLLLYEYNDVEIAEKMLFGIPESQKSVTIPNTAYGGLIEAVQFRIEMGKKYRINILNNNKSQIGEKIAAAEYSRVSGRAYNDFRYQQTERDVVKYSDIILPFVSFQTPQLQEFLTKLKSLKYEPKKSSKEFNPKYKEYNAKFSFEFDLFNCKVSFAQGGIHGVHKFIKKFENIDGIIKKDVDAGSYYPTLYHTYHFSPEHLPGFNDFIGDIISLRLSYKKSNKLYANALKLAINRIFGGFSDNHGWLKDVKALLQTTINGQLLILMLAEEFELNGIEAFYYNTDGLTLMCPTDKEDIYYSIWKRWEQKTLVSLEEVIFDRCYIRDVNNYASIKDDGKVKLKGDYEYFGYIEKYGEFDLTGSFDKPIVAYAASQYLLYGIPIRETILNHRDIYDFCVANKTGKQFENVLFKRTSEGFKEEVIQQSVRFYISVGGDKLLKAKPKTPEMLKEMLNLNGKRNKKQNKKSVPDGFRLVTEDKIGDDLTLMEHGDKWLTYRKPDSLFGGDTLLPYLSYTDVAAGKTITLFNEAFELEDFSGYKIDYEYYIQEAEKLASLKNLETVESETYVEQLIF